MAEAMDRAERDLIVCGHGLTREDVTIVGHWHRWLRGARDVWDDEGNDVVRINQGE
jgi:hypothetical protein